MADWKVVEKAVLTETCLDLNLDARLGFCLAEYLVEMWGAGLDYNLAEMLERLLAERSALKAVDLKVSVLVDKWVD